MHRSPLDSPGRFVGPARTSLIIALVLSTPAAVASGQSRLIFTEYEFDNPQVRSVELDGGNPELLFSPPSPEWLPVGCDYDDNASKLYWTNGNFNAGTIRRANLDGSGLELLVAGLKLPRGMALDLTGGKMYWTNSPPAGNASGLIQRADLSGTGVETVFELVPYDPVLSFVGRPSVDPVNGYVYFCADGEILRTQLDGSPPLQTIVRGVTTVTAVALDVANDTIYFLDANTNSDYLGRARLDDTEFTVLVDMSPGTVGSSGLIDLVVDTTQGKIYWSNELTDTISRADLDGGNVEPIFTSAGGASPTGLTFDVNSTHPIQDCNDNGIRDLDDLLAGTSDDCNGNGIPDECENDPCAPEVFLVDYGSDPSLAARSLSGDPATGYEILQAFDVDEPEVTLARIGLDGHTLSYHPAGFRLSLFPDDGTGTFPDESTLIASADYQLRFGLSQVVWVYRPFSATLGPGRYWVRLTALDPSYSAGAHAGISGPPSLSRRLGTGQVVQASRSIALRIDTEPASTAVSDQPIATTPVAPISISAPAPNPSRGPTAITIMLDQPGRLQVSVFDASGRRVRVIDGGVRAAGNHALEWDGNDDAGRPVSSGVYFVQASLGRISGAAHRTTASQRMLVLR